METEIQNMKEIIFNQDMTKSKLLLNLFLNNNLGKMKTNGKIDKMGFMKFECVNPEFASIFNTKNLPDSNFRETICYVGEIILKNNLNIFKQGVTEISTDDYLKFVKQEFDYAFGYAYDKKLKKLTFTFHMSLISKIITNNIKFNIYNKGK